MIPNVPLTAPASTVEHVFLQHDEEEGEVGCTCQVILLTSGRAGERRHGEREIVKRIISGACASILAVVSTSIAFAPVANSAPTKFTSCDAMHKYYKYGISKDKSSQQKAVQTGMYKPSLQPRVYADSYKTLDRDKDGTMCEVPR